MLSDLSVSLRKLNKKVREKGEEMAAFKKGGIDKRGQGLK